MRTRAFWLAVVERAGKTAAQTAVALLAADGVDLLSLDWRAAGVTVAGAALLSVLTSVASGALPIGPPGSPSLVDDQPGRHALREY